jgi:hypothetical protein
MLRHGSWCDLVLANAVSIASFPKRVRQLPACKSSISALASTEERMVLKILPWLVSIAIFVKEAI